MAALTLCALLAGGTAGNPSTPQPSGIAPGESLLPIVVQGPVPDAEKSPNGDADRTAAPPAVDVASVNPGVTIERDLCLTVAMGDGAAYECGQLRLAHALPAARTMNRPRVPVLLFNSAHADVAPVIAANVTLPAGEPAPDSVVGVMRIGGAERGRGVWPGSQWAPGAARRISVQTYAADLATGIYAYTLEVTAWRAGAGAAATAVDSLAVVNRRASPFRPGWWLAGLEELYPARMLWVGGDGSTRRYRSTGGNTWSAETLDGPDVLTFDGTHYTRHLKGGTRVRFDTAGRHVATVNRLGWTTTFAYQGSTRVLASITLPVASGAAPSYAFAYGADGLLQSVTAPGGRVATVSWDAAASRLTVRDPDQRAVRFDFHPGTWVVKQRIDRRETVTRYYTGWAGLLSGFRVHMAGAAEDPSDLVTRFHPAETRGIRWAGAVDTSQAFTMIDGPRALPAGDTLRIWVNRWGAPRRIRNALGFETVITRGNTAYPALATEVRGPNGYVRRAEYDGRGNVSRVIGIGGLGDARNDTTTYLYYDAAWPDFPTRVISPEKEETVVSYRADGSPEYEYEIHRGYATHVAYTYNAHGQVSAVATPGDRARGTSERYEYDPATGNLAAVVSRLGFRTTYAQDGLGRDTLVQSPIDEAQTKFAATRTRYDAMDRDTLVRSVGPAVTYQLYLQQPQTVPAESTFVRKEYDEEGNLVTVITESDPDVVGPVTTQYVYDRASRRTREVSGGVMKATVYDHAGNVIDGYNERGLHTTMEYDALNRLVSRVVPDAAYAGDTLCAAHSTRICTYRFPLYPNEGIGLRLAGETATFAYDAAGNLARADNSAARVRRTYFPNGLLATDTLRIRTWGAPPDKGCGGTGVCPEAGGEVGTESVVYPDSEFVNHVYALSYTYDLNARRRSVTLRQPPYPDRTASYAYHPWGALSQVTDVEGKLFTFAYDDDGQLVTQGLPGITEQYRYDAEGRLAKRWGALHSDTLAYDARGKARYSHVVGGSAGFEFDWAYSGLGTLVASQSGAVGTVKDIEEFRPDPLGHMAVKTTLGAQSGLNSPRSEYAYSAGTSRVGRIVTKQTGPGLNPEFLPQDTTYNVYDAAGNVVSTGSRVYADLGSTTLRLTSKTAANYYYGGDEKLRVTQTYSGSSDTTNVNDRGSYEEYRYDALGRRVAVRTRQESNICRQECTSRLERHVWDGDQLLLEIRAPGGDAATALEMEHDAYTGTQFGRVTYTHGPGIDAPLSLWRTHHPAGNTLVVPHANSRGAYDAGTRGDGTRHTCGGSGQGCLYIVWPAPYRAMYWNGDVPKGDWAGGLVQEQADQSGLMYRRNRYYNPQTGQFTQQDPIGIAGGLNTYGFANGDPVTYSDPFGLNPGPILWAALEIAGTAFDVYDAGRTGVRFLRGEASRREVVATGAGTVFGAVTVGAGYGLLARRLSRHRETIEGVERQYENIMRELSTHDHLQAARLENTGRINTGYDHPQELANFANGFRNSIIRLKGILSDSEIPDAMRAEATRMLSRLSRQLDAINRALRR